MKNSKKALLFGASGFVGSYLLEQLLQDVEYEQVITVVRTPLPIRHPKLHMIIGDYGTLPGLKDQLKADEIFITLGSGSYEVEHGYPVMAASFAKEHGAKAVLIVTAVQADPKSRSAYVRVKGEIERDILRLGFEHTHLFRPSMIMGHRPEFRPMELAVMFIWRIINPFFLGKMDKYKGTSAQDIATAMHQAAKRPSDKVNFYYWKEMEDLNR
ncbi:MAG: NAD(P)H-binding protein [Paenibacillaceae bacterium]|uniref:NAD(P)H-binding protein n=1 Tax=Paenibacillus mellifer TaxID=2937794 RepID=A0A9X1Y2F6_9BACL|nr:NAD(P)H-binding protein [Paenibacillus mellifer]MBW4840914.1 NAD(P)H-binding protein [Paenibacillaceae bacterium]MCK8489343.1 NAD(P)H-binding protein [Paenibacillus mellifer]